MVKIKDEVEKKTPRPKVEHTHTNVVRTRSLIPDLKELRAIAWCILQSYKIYKRNFRLNPAPTPTALIFIDAYKFLNKSKDKIVRKYLSKLDIRFKGIDLEEY